MNAQNFASLTLSVEQLTSFDAALTQMEASFIDLISLNPGQRQLMVKMGDKTEVFARQVLSMLQQNPQAVPPNLLLSDALADLLASDQLQPRLQRLTQLYQRILDTQLALRSDVMSLALQGYKLLKVTGRGAGLEPLQRELRSRFTRKRRPASEVAPAA